MDPDVEFCLSFSDIVENMHLIAINKIVLTHTSFFGVGGYLILHWKVRGKKLDMSQCQPPEPKPVQFCRHNQPSSQSPKIVFS